MPLTPSTWYKKISWMEDHQSHYVIVTFSVVKSLLLGDSSIAGLKRYDKFWKKYFSDTLNIWIVGDRMEIFFWRAINLVANYMVDSYEQYLEKLDFSNYQNYNDISEVYNNFIKKIMSVTDKVTPVKKER